MSISTLASPWGAVAPDAWDTDEIHFRLVGAAGRDLDSDLHSVLDMEQTLVLDPIQLKTDMALAASAFTRSGAQVSANSRDTLAFVAEHGYIVLAQLDDNPVAYQYGFWSMPEDDRFPSLSVSTLDLCGADQEQARRRCSSTLMTWRTGVLPVFQRFGVASALKAVCLRCAQLFGKTHASSNIGSLDGKAINLASLGLNKEVLLPWTWRTIQNRIELDGETVCSVRWLALANDIPAALTALTKPDGVLRRKGWSVTSLMAAAEEIAAHVRRGQWR